MRPNTGARSFKEEEEAMTDLPDNWELKEEHEVTVDVIYDEDIFVNIKWDGCINIYHEHNHGIHICDIELFAKDIITIKRVYFP